MIEPETPRKNTKWVWLLPACKAVTIGLVATALTLLITALSWQSWMGYTHEIYQEFATAKPEDGLRDSVGFRGELPFFWEEILTSKAFGLSVLKKAGQTPYSYSEEPRVHARRWVESDPKRKQGLFLVARRPYQSYRYEGPAGTCAPEFRSVAEAFVEAANERGVDVTPVGEIQVGSLDGDTWRSFVRSWWLRITLACCSTSLVAAWLFGGFSQRCDGTIVLDTGGRLVPWLRTWSRASLAWWGRKPVWVGFGVGVGMAVLVGVGVFWVHLSDYRAYRYYVHDRESHYGFLNAMANMSEEQVRKMQENMNRGNAYPNFVAANARSSFAMELYVQRGDDLAIQRMCEWSLSELIAKVDEGLKEGGLYGVHEQFWQRRKVVERFMEEHPELRAPIDSASTPLTVPMPQESSEASAK